MVYLTWHLRQCSIRNPRTWSFLSKFLHINTSHTQLLQWNFDRATTCFGVSVPWSELSHHPGNMRTHVIAVELHMYWWFLTCTIRRMSTSKDQNHLGFCLSYGQETELSDQILATRKQKWVRGFLSQNPPLCVALDTGVKQRHPLKA